MKKLINVVYILATICIGVLANLAGYEDGKNEGYKNGVSFALNSIIEVEILTPESLDKYLKYKINEDCSEHN